MATTVKDRKRTKPLRTVIPAGDAQRQFGQYINTAGLGSERYVITRHEFPVAAIISIADLAKLEALEASEAA